MPELPEVETTRRGLNPAMSGKRIEAVELRRANLRFPFQADFCARLEGRTVERLERRAKYLIIPLDSGDALVAHLGMSGSFRIANGNNPAPLYHETARRASHDHVIFHISDGGVITYNDPRRFGYMFVSAHNTLGVHPRFSGVGLEPLEPQLTGPALAQALKSSSAPLKTALLDQKKIAGLGNIYVCEALHHAGLSPWRIASTLAENNVLARKKANGLAQAIRAVLEAAIAAGGSSLRDFSGADGKPGYFQHNFHVYDREGAPCPTPGCSGVIARAPQAGRSTFFCATCQI